MPGGTKKSNNKSRLARTSKELKEEQGLKKPSKVKLAVRVKKEHFVEKEPLKQEKEARKEKVGKAEEAIIKNSFPKQSRRSVNWEQTEKSKRMIMWSGVTFFMILISVAWIYNTKTVIKKNKLENDSSFSWEELSKITDDISGEIEKMKEGVEDLKEISSSVGTSTEMAGLPSSGLIASTSSSSIISELDQEQVNELKEKLEIIKQKIEE